MQIKIQRKRVKYAVIAGALLLVLALLVMAGVFLLTKPTGMAHYLLVGVDGWGVNVEGAGRSDVVMLASLDYDGNRILLTSFARDALVEPSFRKNAVKLNTLVRSTAGEQALVDYLEEAFISPIDGYFVVNFSGAVEIIDAIGGVSVEITGQEVSYLKQHAGDYDGYHLHEGLCRMNGAQALAYMRCRNLDNDFGRQNRQGNVLRALMEELSDITSGKALSLLDNISGMYRSSLSAAQQVELAKNAVHMRHAQLEKYSIPAEGTYRYGTDNDGASALRFDLEQNQVLLREWLGIEIAADVEE